jgi:hypothetical protein
MSEQSLSTASRAMAPIVRMRPIITLCKAAKDPRISLLKMAGMNMASRLLVSNGVLRDGQDSECDTA